MNSIDRSSTVDSEKRLYVIPHFHYDLAWIYTEKQCLQKAYRILNRVIQIMEKDHNFTYVIDQAYYLEKMKQEKPQLFHNVAEKIREDRIEVANAGYVMPDLNLVSPYAIRRNFEIMNEFAKEEFDTKPKVAWMIDCFGHPGIMPQITKTANLKYYVFWRGMTAPECTQDFMWTGTDGTTVLTHWMKHSYSLLGNRFEDLTKAAYVSEPSTNIVFIPFGDDFYSPHEKLIKQIHKTKNAEFALPSQFFKEIEKHKSKLPTINGEMLSDYSNFKGCYSSRVRFKQLYRNAEKTLLNKEASDDEWKNLLYATFHDLICGTGIDEVYPKAERKLKKINVDKKTLRKGKPYKGKLLERVSFELWAEEGDLYNTIPSTKVTLPENSVKMESQQEKSRLDLLIQTDFQNPRHVLKLIIRTGIKKGRLLQHFYDGSRAERHPGIPYVFNDFFEYKDQEGNGIRMESDDCFDYEVKNNGDICLTLVRSVQILSHGDAGPRIPCLKALELGARNFRISLFPIGKNIFF